MEYFPTVCRAVKAFFASFDALNRLRLAMICLRQQVALENKLKFFNWMKKKQRVF
jgi:hypothetical protein